MILKKEKGKLNNEKISKEFLKNQNKSGIVAYYIYNKARTSTLIQELNSKKNEYS
jgi:hypothetical protein